MTRNGRTHCVPDCDRGPWAWTGRSATSSIARLLELNILWELGLGWGALWLVSCPHSAPSVDPTPISQELVGVGVRSLLVERRCGGREVSGSDFQNPGPCLSTPGTELFSLYFKGCFPLQPPRLIWGNFTPYFILSTEKIEVFNPVKYLPMAWCFSSFTCNPSAVIRLWYFPESKLGSSTRSSGVEKTRGNPGAREEALEDRGGPVPFPPQRRRSHFPYSGDLPASHPTPAPTEQRASPRGLQSGPRLSHRPGFRRTPIRCPNICRCSGTLFHKSSWEAGERDEVIEQKWASLVS